MECGTVPWNTGQLAGQWKDHTSGNSILLTSRDSTLVGIAPFGDSILQGSCV